ncbi:MAG TPA: DNA-3-methyladenine glycosylase 2 family protein [Desulfobacterales bacterium]|nr:DNA-3-methyladenine glycosylase 2 family protein [Desulfobacterales bacterium]
MKQLTNADYKKIILRRDPRYDGRLYFGVTTTKIYCRPVCPARPKPENIIIFRSASEAEKAGCRPCLRCRPDLAPGNKYISPGKNIVGNGLRLIEESTSENKSVEEIASKLDISARHLRRVFKEQLGASPIEIMQTRKLHLTKQLLIETGEPIAEIAYATGFNSIRRFNEAFKTTYRRTPSEVRNGRQCKVQAGDGLTLTLMVRKPYDFTSVLAFLKRHAARGIEKVTANSYERYVPDKKTFSTIRVTTNKKEDALLVNLRGFKLDQVSTTLLNIRRLFDTDHNPAHLPATSAARQTGVRVPGSFDPFETAVSIILGQLVSIQQATGKLAELIEHFGSSYDGKPPYCFPQPVQLMAAEIEEIGITRSKAGAIRALSAMIHNHELHFSHSSDLLKTRKQLLSVKGIGPWTTEMIMMRCFGDADAFPESDLIILRALEQNLVDETLWKTNRSYMTHYVWNKFAQTLSKHK